MKTICIGYNLIRDGRLLYGRNERLSIHGDVLSKEKPWLYARFKSDLHVAVDHKFEIRLQQNETMNIKSRRRAYS